MNLNELHAAVREAVAGSCPAEAELGAHELAAELSWAEGEALRSWRGRQGAGSRVNRFLLDPVPTEDWLAPTPTSQPAG